MKSIVLIGVGLLLVPQAADPAQTSKKRVSPPPAAALQGKWNVVEMAFNGSKLPAEQAKKRMLVFSADEFAAYNNGKRGRAIRYKLDAKAKTPRIDLATTTVAKHALGIYRVSDDTLRLCYGEPGAERPRKFKSEAGSRVFLIVLKRAKEAD